MLHSHAEKLQVLHGVLHRRLGPLALHHHSVERLHLQRVRVLERLADRCLLDRPVAFILRHMHRYGEALDIGRIPLHSHRLVGAIHFDMSVEAGDAV